MEQIESYPVERNWRPAFVTPLSTLPQPRRAYLPDLPGKRPPVSPFGSQSLTIAATIHALRTGSLSATGLVEHMVAAIDRQQPILNAFVYVTPVAELQALAYQLDAELHAGICRGTLHGIPLAVKGLFDVAGMPSTGSPVLDDSVAPSDAGSVRLLKAAGAAITGKTRTYNPFLDTSTSQRRNRSDATHHPKGFSDGSAIAVATGMSLGTMATDTRASLCVPAAIYGVVGYKPTYGLVPSDGLGVTSWSLDHVGHMASTVEDAALMLDVLDPAPHVQYSHGLHKNMRNVRVGVPTAALEGAETGVKAAFRQAVDAMRQTGAEVTEIETPSTADFDLAASIGLVITGAEAAACHAVNGERSQRYAATVTQQMDGAAQISAFHYLQAQRAREDLRWRILRSFDHFDAILMPTTRVAPKSDETAHDFLFLSQNSILWSVLGFPAITFPCGGTPLHLRVGVQLVAAPYEDARLLSIAAALELELSRR